MKTIKEDRRSRRTRQLLGSALVELMLEKRYDAITVQDILDRADVGRSTFYEHFADKEDLLVSQINRIIHQLDADTAKMGQSPGVPVPSLEFFRHIREHKRLVHAFIRGRGIDMLVKETQAQLSKVAEENLTALVGTEVDPSVPISVVASFVVNTFFMMVQWWFENDLRHTPEQMDTMFQKLVMPSVYAILGRDDPTRTGEGRAGEPDDHQ